MKTIFSLFIISFFSLAPFFLSSQENDSTLMNKDTIQIQENFSDTLPEIFKTDNILNLISRYIPLNWNVSIISDTLIFLNTSPVYKMSDAQMKDTTRKGRSKVKDIHQQKAEYVKIRFILQPPWTGSQVEDAKLKNSHTQAQLDKLLKKYKITHLAELINSEDFDIETASLTSNEKKSVQRYYEEKEKLEKELLITPNYHTTNFSLFLLDYYPEDKDRHLFTPPGIIQDIDLLIGLFEKYAGK